MKKVALLVLAFICILSFFACNQSKPNDETNPDTLDESQVYDDTTPDSLDSSQVSEATTPLPEYLEYDDEYQHYNIILPISKTRVGVDPDFEDQLDNIDIELLKSAEEILTDKMSTYKDQYYFGLQGDSSGHLCLFAEAIVPLDPPEIITGESGWTSSIDHKHIFFIERIAK
jgi:hypothetical protein